MGHPESSEDEWATRRKVLEGLEQIQSLPRRKQDAILTTIDHFLRSATG